MYTKLLLKDIYDTLKYLNKYFIHKFSIRYFIISSAHFLLTFYTDTLIFKYTNTNLFFIIKSKFIFLILLTIIWQFIGFIVRNSKKSSEIRDFIKFSGIYFGTMMIFQFALWPFIVGDQMYYGYFSDSVYLTTNTSAFQGLFIRYFRIYALMLIPNLAGIIIAQIVIVSLIIGYVMLNLKLRFKLADSVYIFYIPFLTPLIIQHNLHIEKDILSGYFAMLLFAILIFKKFDISSVKININLFLIAIVSAIVASIRPGSILFFAATPILIYFLNRETINLRKIFLFFIFSIFFSFIFVPNYIRTVVINKNGEAYKNIYILNSTFKVLLHKAVSERNKDILYEFQDDTYLNLRNLLKEDIDDINFFINLTEQDKEKFNNISRKLMKEYFNLYASYKFQIFYHNLSIIDLNSDINNMLPYYDGGTREKYNSIKEKIGLTPPFYSGLINFFKKYNSYITLPGYNFLSNFFIIMYCALFIISLFFGMRKIFILTCFLIFYTVLEALIVPYSGFRFYFPFYLTGYFFIFYMTFCFIKHGCVRYKIKQTDI